MLVLLRKKYCSINQLLFLLVFFVVFYVEFKQILKILIFAVLELKYLHYCAN